MRGSVPAVSLARAEEYQYGPRMLIPMRLLSTRARTPEALEAARERRRSQCLEIDQDADRERFVELNGAAVVSVGPWTKRETRMPRYLLEMARRKR